jgi:hypothetical protein
LSDDQSGGGYGMIKNEKPDGENTLHAFAGVDFT